MSSEDNNSIENDIEEVNHPYGKPETIATFLNEGINANYKKLLQMFLNDEVKNRKIVVLSIVGAFRRGKSFFLNYCLRYLYANYKSINYPENSPINSKNWMGDQNEPLIGFSSRPGITRDTTGMIFWDDIFLYNNEKTGEKLAIVVMDTQGLFDNDTSTQDNSRIFALSTLISSIQILNLTGVIQEDQLQYLQFATEFAKFATMNSSFGKAFQKLIFLIRDWDNCSEHDYGFKGGMQYLNSILETKQNQNDELKSIRQFIKESFSDLSCFLHPDPGDRVANRRKYKTDYNGNWGEMSEDFRSQLIQLIENILRPENLIVKKFAENDLKGQDFYEYIEDYFNLFQSDNLPQAQTIYQSAIEKYMKKIIDQCVARYKEIVYSNHDILTNVDQIPVLHKLGKDQALIEYEDSKKMGDLILQDKYRNTLDQQIDKICQNEWGNQSEKNVKKINEEKEKTKLIMEEKKKLEIEHKENERKNVEYIKELRRIDHEKQREFEKTIKEQELEQINLLAEQEVIRQEKLKELEQLNAQKKIDKEKFECEKALAEENHKAEIKRIQQEKEFETKMIQEERKLQKEEHEKAMAVAEANVANERAELEKLKAQDKANKEIIAKLKVENEKDKYQHYYEKEKNQMLYTSESIYNLFNIDNAIITGQDSDGNDIYVGRALHNEHFYPAKIISSTNKKMCSIAFNGQEIEKKRFGVLSGAHEWKTFKDGIPERATSVGKNEKNESMYIGRSMHNGYYIPGTIVKGTNYISIPYCGSKSISKPKTVLTFSTEEKIEIEDEYLNSLFEHPEVAQRKIVVFSIIGAYRQGKSFFMNYCLRYLYANYQSIKNLDNNFSNSDKWMGDKNEPLIGFSWRDGLYRETTGIVIWDDIFLHTYLDGEKIAIIVMDTHGLFDNETTPLNNSRIFALGTLLSSIQVFNIANVIQEDQLQYLQYAIEFANFSFSQNESSREKNFQRLIFLLRNWTNDDDYAFGIDGGAKYLKYFLESNPDGEDKLRSSCQDISDAFEILSCCLLPPPGDRIRIQRKYETVYNGNWGEMNSAFSIELFKIIDELLKPDNLKIKKVEGRELSGLEYLQYARKCFKQFNSDRLPETPSIYQASIETHMRKLVDLCFGEYKQNFESIVQIDREKVADQHSDLIIKALQIYKNSKKMGDDKIDALFRNKLEQKIIDSYKSWCVRIEDNKKKIEIVVDNMQKKLKMEHQVQLKIKMEAKKEAEERIEIKQQKRREYEIERIKRYRQIPSLLIDRKLEEIIRIPLDSNSDVTEGQLKLLLENPNVSSCKIVPISIVGALKSNGSYILNYCLRYLYAHHPSLSYPDYPVLDSENWFAKKGDSLEDITCKPKLKLDSTGIVFWNDVFFHTTSYEKIAIVLLDTHAIYDNDKPSLDVLRILEFGTMLSSVQIFPLEHLNQAIDLAMLCNQVDHKSKPFQNIGLLVNKSATSLKFSPSMDILKQHLIQIIQNNQIDLYATSIHESFQNFKCYELYLPGCRGKTYSEDSNEEEDQFKNMLISVIEAIMRPESLKAKINNDKELNGIEYLEYVKQCFQKFKSQTSSATPSNFNAVVKKYLSNSANLSFEFYKEKIAVQIDNHEELKEQACERYKLSYKIGSELQINKYKEMLINEIEDYYNNSIQLVKPYLKEIEVLKEDLKNIQLRYDNMVKEMDETIHQNEVHYKSQLKSKELEIENLKNKSEIEILCLKDQIEIQKSNNSKLLRENEELKSKFKTEILELKNEKTKMESNFAKRHDNLMATMNDLNVEINSILGKSRKVEFEKQQEINSLTIKLQNYDEEFTKVCQTAEDKIGYLTQDLESANAKIKRLEEEKVLNQQATTSRERNENQTIINEHVGKFQEINRNFYVRNFLEALKTKANKNTKDMLTISTIFIKANQYDTHYELYISFKNEKLLKTFIKEEKYSMDKKKYFDFNGSFVSFFYPNENMVKVRNTSAYYKPNSCFQFITTKELSVLDCLKFIDDEDSKQVECISVTTYTVYISFFDENIAQKYVQTLKSIGFNTSKTNIYFKFDKLSQNYSQIKKKY